MSHIVVSVDRHTEYVEWCIDSHEAELTLASNLEVVVLGRDLKPDVAHQEVDRLERGALGGDCTCDIVRLVLIDLVDCEEVVQERLKVEVRDVDVRRSCVHDSVQAAHVIQDSLIVHGEVSFESSLSIADTDSTHAHGPVVIVIDWLVVHLGCVYYVCVDGAVIDPGKVIC